VAKTEDYLGGRLPLLTEGELSDKQKQIYQRMLTHQIPWSDSHNIEGMTGDGRLIGPYEAYAKLSLKKYRPMAARNEDKKVFSGLL
jgi:hypothetical protein